MEVIAGDSDLETEVKQYKARFRLNYEEGESPHASSFCMVTIKSLMIPAGGCCSEHVTLSMIMRHQNDCMVIIARFRGCSVLELSAGAGAQAPSGHLQGRTSGCGHDGWHWPICHPCCAEGLHGLNTNTRSQQHGRYAQQQCRHALSYFEGFFWGVLHDMLCANCRCMRMTLTPGATTI